MKINPLKIANDAIHQLNTKVPYISTSKTYRMIKDIGIKNKVSPYLINYTELCNPNDFSNRDKTPLQKHVLAIYQWFSKLVTDFAEQRISKFSASKQPFEYVTEVFEEVKKLKLANCDEIAVLTAMILKAKGIKNAYAAALSTNIMNIDHVVTVFNKDGSVFDGEIINNKTVIADAWLGIADYAGNYFSKHRGICKNFVRIPEDKKISFRNIRKFDLDDMQIEELKRMYPEILCKNK